MIAEIRTEHSLQLATLHLTHLNSPFQGKPGKELLRLYYQAVCQGRGACGFLALEGDKIQGYVCGVWDAVQLKKTMLKHSWFQLALWSLLQVLVKPALITDFLARFRESTALSDQSENGYELRPIVVTIEARGTGMASELVKRLLDDAARRGYPEIFLFTKAGNLTANRFYQKFGFDCVGQEIRAGQIYRRYEHLTEGFA